MTDEQLIRLTQLVKGNMIAAYPDAKRCQETLSAEPSNPETQFKAMVFLNRAARTMDLVYGIYQGQLEDLDHRMFNPVFNSFNKFYQAVTEQVVAKQSGEISDREFHTYRMTLCDFVPEARE